MHVTSTLDPKSFYSLSMANRALFEHVSNDRTWKIAFSVQFLGLEPESEIDDPKGKALLLRRIESSWKKEFIARWALLRRLRDSRSPTISHTPHHGIISSMMLLNDRASLLTSSLEHGVVSRSIPFTGKVLKGHLDTHGSLNGIGNPNAEFPPGVSVIGMYPSPQGVSAPSSQSTPRVVWGFFDGCIACTTAPKVMSLDKSARSAKFVRCRVQDMHPGVVSSVAFGEEGVILGGIINDSLSFVSACRMGVVKLWESKSMTCLWTGSVVELGDTPHLASLGDSQLAIQKVAYDAVAGHIVAALQCGDVALWSGMDVRVKACGPSSAPTPSVTPVSLTAFDTSKLEFRFLRSTRLTRPSAASDITVSMLSADRGVPNCLFLQKSQIKGCSYHVPDELRFGVSYTGEPGFYRFAISFRSADDIVAQDIVPYPVQSSNVTKFSGISASSTITLFANLVPISHTQQDAPTRPDSVSEMLVMASSKGVDVSTPPNFPIASPSLALSTSISTSVTEQQGPKPRSFVVGGDTLGFVSIWDWDSIGVSDSDRCTYPVTKARYRWEAYNDASVTAIGMSETAIATGSSSGRLSLWNLATFELIRSFMPLKRSTQPHSHITQPGPDLAVSQIIFGHEVLVASIGNRAVAWRALLGESEAKSTLKSKRRRGNNATAKWHLQMELRNDIAESRKELDDEHTTSLMAHNRLRDQVSTMQELGLDEIEAVEYALMLSRDEEEARIRANVAERLTQSIESDDGPFSDDILDVPGTCCDNSESIPSLGDPTPEAVSFSSIPDATHSQSPHLSTPIPSPPVSARVPPSSVSFPILACSLSPRSFGSPKIMVSPRTRLEPTGAGSSFIVDASLLCLSPHHGDSMAQSSSTTNIASIDNTTDTHTSRPRPSTMSANQAAGLELASGWPPVAPSSVSASPAPEATPSSSTGRSWSAVVCSPVPPALLPTCAIPASTANVQPVEPIFTNSSAAIAQGGSYAAKASSGGASLVNSASGGVRARPSLLTASLAGHNLTQPVSAKDKHDRTLVVRPRAMSHDRSIPILAPLTREAEDAELALALEMSLAEAGVKA
ncbi:uncharacterized protein EI90DRAFT_3159748 [Cantharellus anzutake]|uniref:uncharacterized protein n=1 Tax=Cantharellus anzutake TaxID=1750568 RepID=UPI0019037D03|nr:uncharacterized protein EI90DRAFT_3159748 [Cantharellus anzutake]KAF8313309.1 hypothetical protein EI90DRAFT_3159748 [Cantharellus anzutake]